MTAEPEKGPTEVVTETQEPEVMMGSVNGPQRREAEGDALDIADVRTGRHRDFDRVVIEFSGKGTPGYTADYVREPVQQGSGTGVDVPGNAFIDLNVKNLVPPYENPDSAWPIGMAEGTPQGKIAGVNHQGVFEGNGQFIIGIEGPERPFSVSVLANPPRVVVDIEH